MESSAGGPMKKRGYFTPLILSSFTIMVSVFLLWELIQRNFFAEVDMSTLHFLYITRGVALGLILTTWAVWFILKYRKEYEEAQKELRDQLFQAEKLAALGELTGGVAHEINNPVGIMISRMALMLEDAKTQRDRPNLIHDLEVLQKQASRIGTITQSLLSFARKSGAEH